MNVEERLRDALSEQADALDVDLLRMHAEIRARGTAASPPRRRPDLLVAASLLLVAGTAVAGVLLAGLWPGGRLTDPATDRPQRAHVDSSFSCDHQRAWRFENGRAVGDDGFVPDLANGPEAMARLVGAPRYDLAVHEDEATLRLGNDDGTLASRSRFVRGPDGWEPVRALTCQGDGSPLVDGPGGDADRLVSRPATPGAHDRPLRPRDVGAGARLLDSRGYYDVSGLVHDRTLWAGPCGRKLCVRAGLRDSYVAADVTPGVRPTNLTSMFLPPDDMVGTAPPYAFVVVAADDTTVTWRDTSGTSHEAERVDDVWYVLAPFEELAEVVVEPPDGEPRGWTLDEMR